jgi:hypothetical protein
MLIVFDAVFREDFCVTVTTTTQVPDFTAVIFPAVTLQYFAEDFGTLTVTFAPVGTLRFAVLAILLNVAGLLLLIVNAFAVVVTSGATGVEGTLVLGIDGLSGSGLDGLSGSGLDGISASEQTMFAWTATLHFDRLVYNRRFAVPLETFVRTFELADPVIAEATAAEDADGNKPLTTAA